MRIYSAYKREIYGRVDIFVVSGGQSDVLDVVNVGIGFMLIECGEREEFCDNFLHGNGYDYDRAYRIRDENPESECDRRTNYIRTAGVTYAENTIISAFRLPSVRYSVTVKRARWISHRDKRIDIWAVMCGFAPKEYTRAHVSGTRRQFKLIRRKADFGERFTWAVSGSERVIYTDGIETGERTHQRHRQYRKDAECRERYS